MKSKLYFFLLIIFSVAIVSCSDDDDDKKKGDPDITHEGQKWTVASIDYTLVDQSTSGTNVKQVFKDDVATNAGTFYFPESGTKGSFEISVEGYNKEDYFNYSLDDGQINIVTIEQQAGSQIGQNIIAISGTANDTEMILSGAITKQSTTGQFILEMELVLHKQ